MILEIRPLETLTASMSSVLILGVGNTLMTDDGVGVYAARRARVLLSSARAADIAVAEAEYAGFALLELLEGYDHAVIIDAVHLSGAQAGDVRVLPSFRFRATTHLTGVHQVDLPTALALGRQMGVHLPHDAQVVGVQVQEDRAFGEACTPRVQSSIEVAATRAIDVARRMAASPGVATSTSLLEEQGVPIDPA
jgi:hydrogenase maturation protease